MYHLNFYKLLIYIMLVFGFISFVHAAGSYSPPSANKNSNETNKNTLETEEDKKIKIIINYLSNNDFSKANALAKEAVIEFPNNADLWNYLGFSSRKINLLNESKDAYEKALKIDENHVGALEYFGELYLTLEKPEKAKELLIRLKELCSFNCKEMQDLEKAISNYEGS